MAYIADGRLYPSVGDRLRHRAMGWVGTFVEVVFANKDRRHFLVQSVDSPQRWITLDSDWEVVDGKEG